VTYVNGNLTLSGNQSGAGVLAVNGDLTFSGNVAFTGLVLVSGNIRFSGGGSSKMIRGSLMIGGDAALADVFTLNGGVDLQYSSAVITRVNTAVSKWSAGGWREIARP
jgi:hypothetical protein